MLVIAEKAIGAWRERERELHTQTRALLQFQPSCVSCAGEF